MTDTIDWAGLMACAVLARGNHRYGTHEYVEHYTSTSYPTEVEQLTAIAEALREAHGAGRKELEAECATAIERGDMLFGAARVMSERADRFESKWRAAKAEFGTAMGKMRARVRELEAENAKLKARL